MGAANPSQRRGAGNTGPAPAPVRPVGAILAGGASQRMGRDKAWVLLRGRPLVSYVAEALEVAGCEAILVGREAPVFGVPAIPDLPVPGAGPAHGLLTALAYGRGRPVVLVAVDQPLLRPSTLLALGGLGGAAVIPLDAGIPQVTCALYRSACAAPLAALLQRVPCASLQRLLALVETTLVLPGVWQGWGETGASWWSVNTPQALAEAHRRGAPPPSLARGSGVMPVGRQRWIG